MSKAPASQFYWGDWLNDVELQTACSASRGIWANALARMWYSKVRGELTATPEKYVQILNCTEQEFDTFLQEAQTLLFCYASRNGNGTVTLRNRRMYREEKQRENTRLRQERFRKQRKSNHRSNGEITVPSSSSSSKRKYIKENSITILSYLNEISNRKFTPIKANLEMIQARLKEGHTEEECKRVIDIKWADPDFDKKYFRPSTLFRPSKFEGYLNEGPKRRYD